MDNTIVITGASTGIGAAIVEKLSAGDNRIINLDIAAAQNQKIETIKCDLSDPTSIAQVVSELPNSLHGVIHVAGIAQGNAAAEKVMSVNFLGMRELNKHLMPKVIDGGSIVIVASSAGRDWMENRSQVRSLLKTQDFDSGLQWLEQNKKIWSDTAYKFSKQCAAAYTYIASNMLHNRNVRVNCVNPGIVESQLSPAFREMIGDERYDQIVDQSGRSGEPKDIAGLIAYLSVGDSHWINGIELTVDGGYYAGEITKQLMSD